MLAQQRRAGHQGLHRQAAGLQRLEHRVVGVEQAAIGQAHHQQIHIRAAAGAAPGPAAEQPEALGVMAPHQPLQRRQQVGTQGLRQLGGLEAADGQRQGIRVQPQQLSRHRAPAVDARVLRP